MSGVHLFYDGVINLAARRGDNDEAYEYTILQRQYYENYADRDGPQWDEWNRRQEKIEW